MAAVIADLAIGAGANVIGHEVSQIADGAQRLIQDEINNVKEWVSKGNKKRRQNDLASCTNDETQHKEDLHVMDEEVNNDIEINKPAMADGPNSLNGHTNHIQRGFTRDKLYAAAPAKWAVEHLRQKIGGDLFPKLCSNIFVTGIGIDYSFYNATAFPATLRMILVEDVRERDPDALSPLIYSLNREDFFAKSKGGEQIHFDQSGTRVYQANPARKTQMKINPEHYRVHWQKWINLAEKWPGAFSSNSARRNYCHGRFYIKCRNGIRVKPVFRSQENVVIEDPAYAVNKLIPCLKLLFFWEHNNITMCTSENENLTSALAGYVHMTTYLKH